MAKKPGLALVKTYVTSWGADIALAIKLIRESDEDLIIEIDDREEWSLLKVYEPTYDDNGSL